MDDVITVGDKVYIGGLFGTDFEEINYRVGKIEKIVSTSNLDKSTFFAEINLGDYTIPVDFHYIFKLNSDGIDYNLTVESLAPISHFFRKYNIVKYKLAIDQDGQAHCFSITMGNKVEVFTLTNLN